MTDKNRAMLLLVCNDHFTYYDASHRCILERLPFPVVVVTNRSSARYFAHLGSQVEVRVTSWGNFDNVRADAHAIAKERPLFAIGTAAEGLLELAAELRHSLRIPGAMPEEVGRFRNKITMKQLLSTAGVRVPRFSLCSDRAEVYRLLSDHGKLVIKPVDGFGSRAVHFIESVAELDDWYAKEKAEEFEAEEFIEGSLYHVNAVVREGQTILVASALYLPGMANIDFSKGTPFATVLVPDSPLRDRLERFSQSVIEGLQLKNGVTHLECFLTQGGELVFCEIGARPGGGGIAQMIELQFGLDYVSATLLFQAGMGAQIRVPPARSAGIMGLIGFRAASNCRPVSLAGPSDFPEDWIRFARHSKQPGQFIAAAKHCTDFICLLVFECDNEEHFRSRSMQLQDRFDSLLRLA